MCNKTAVYVSTAYSFWLGSSSELYSSAGSKYLPCSESRLPDWVHSLMTRDLAIMLPNGQLARDFYDFPTSWGALSTAWSTSCNFRGRTSTTETDAFRSSTKQTLVVIRLRVALKMTRPSMKQFALDKNGVDLLSRSLRVPHVHSWYRSPQFYST